MDRYEKSLEAHRKWKGKIETALKAPLTNREELGLAYTPGVARACEVIRDHPQEVWELTGRGNLVAVISDGSAVLGLGDIGAEASLPVMEGKCALFKKFGGVNAVPVVIHSQDPEVIIETIKNISGSFGGINLEDISAPRCVEIERRLIEELDIPVFHDDQHGTAIVVAAALINAQKLVRKPFSSMKAVLSGAGAAGSSILRMLQILGIKDIYAFDSRGILRRDKADQYTSVKAEMASMSNPDSLELSLEEALVGADIFIGVSVPRRVTKKEISSMSKDAIVFALANPEPEIHYQEAIEAGAAIVATGRSDAPNQVNNVLAFPGLFRGALQVRSRKITESMKLAAAKALASLITEEELTNEYIIADPFDPRVAECIAEAVAQTAVEEGIARKEL